jgi:hypothetical protein
MTKKSALWTSVFLLAAAIGTAGAEPVTKAVPVAQCYGANKQILLYELPARTHLQDSLCWVVKLPTSITKTTSKATSLCISFTASRPSTAAALTASRRSKSFRSGLKIWCTS